MFLLAVPVMAAAAGARAALLPEFRDPEAGRLDLLSAALSVAAVLRGHLRGQAASPATASGGCPRLRSWLGWRSACCSCGASTRWPIRCSTCGCSARAGLQRRAGDQPARLLHRCSASSCSSPSTCSSCSGIGPLEAGIVTFPSGIVFALGSMAAPVLLRHFRPGRVITSGFLLAACRLRAADAAQRRHEPVADVCRDDDPLRRDGARPARSRPTSS